MKWQIKKFPEFEVQTLYEMLKLRVDVFVVEQTCPYPELDNKDTNSKTLHICGYNCDGKIIAYARLLPAGLSYEEASIGRIVITGQERGKGLGHELMKTCIKELERTWPHTNVKIGAQEHLQGFYQKHDFVTVSEPYMEDGISHVEMLREYKNA